MTKGQMSIERAITIIEENQSGARTRMLEYATKIPAYSEVQLRDCEAFQVALDTMREKQERKSQKTIVQCDEMRTGIFNLIIAERARQDHKWGAPQKNTFSEWASILAEECGEASAELNELNFGRGNKERAVKELIETAAVAVAAIEQYDVAEMVTAAWYAYRTRPEVTPQRRCRVCGCTDDHACPGGCYWVEPDLCSACVGLEEAKAKEAAHD